jgi:hypothetical protein
MRTLALALALIASPSVFAQVTKWERVDKTLEALLNEGWRIESYNFRLEQNTGNGRPTHTFVLTNASKYVLCDVFLSSVQSGGRLSSVRVSTCLAIN